MPMIDLAKTPEDIKDEIREWGGAVGIGAMVTKYPYGLSISFCQDTLERLNLDGALPEVGSIFKFSAEARVTAISNDSLEDETGNIKEEKRVEAQIVRMEVGGDPPAERARNWYGTVPAAPDINKDGK